MPRVGLEPTAPVSEREKTVDVLDHAPSAIGIVTIVNISKLV
jgi:hypothetical protein